MCAKLIKDNKKPQFSATTSSHPDHLFESLAKTGSIRPDAFPFGLEDSMRLSWFKLLIKRGIDILCSIIWMVILMPVRISYQSNFSGPFIFKQIRLGK